ncbi:hypothetical protein K439DRAFT_1632043 [Ramaria rubella]|nr:hypothetical protein K439DRAFT_1632043 [Ramaria rubella]
MGISGLLPLLKSVHKPTHLSELAGKTIAVDAYVWLHRGAYACATEIVTGKPTTKYVDYAMHRVRLLQYHKITPYIVFDGGPLPAKKGTEVERKRKRDENVAQANALAEQGHHSNARDHYVKCVDITPQMAFQLIKVLRAEQVPYVVAPYEADAQLFHLEASGLVDGILTEDSDLLIFGTQLLLLKLDATTATCTAITANTLASNSSADLPLHGWGVKELRECAMMSGCDYIEGVRGVGLKTASKYLRKWGTVEKALRALRMDGKMVEKDWEDRMRKAEVGFLHQRVWDPRKEEIVYLTEPDWTTWNEEREKFVGRYIEAELAGGLARGDIDPVSLEPMVDIMPSFQPVKRPRPLASKDANRRDTKVDQQPVVVKSSLFQYFTKQSKGATPKVVTTPVLPPPHTMQFGRASGKRTLAEQYDHETSAKRPKKTDEIVDRIQSSKFFASDIGAHLSPRQRLEVAFDDDKENLEELDDLDEVDDNLLLSLRQEGVDTVQQEEGYISPAFSSPERGDATSGIDDATPDISSPLQERSCMLPANRDAREAIEIAPLKIGEVITCDAIDVGSDEEGSLWGSSDGRITSPPSGHKAKTTRTISLAKMEHGHVQLSQPFPSDIQQVSTPQPNTLTVDLRDIFAADTSGSGSSDLEGAIRTPITPLGSYPLDCAVQSDDSIEDDRGTETQLEERHRIVAAGWEKRFSNHQGAARRGSLISKGAKGKEKAQRNLALRRRETMATPFHPGLPRRATTFLARSVRHANKPEPIPPATDLTWTPLRPASTLATPQTGAGPEEIDSASDHEPPSSSKSSQRAAVDDACIAHAETGSIMKLEAYRFR